MSTAKRMAPDIPDYTLLRRIGRGSYGEVWMARSVTGHPRAVKIVRRRRFADSRPYEREFSAIQKYELVCRRHPALLDVLHVGQGQGFFYYVMPLADPLDPAVGFPSESYKPRTLASLLSKGAPLTAQESIGIAQRLLAGLQVLHGAGLVHRDIKPSNVVLLHGAAVLADIGLVTSHGDNVSGVGTPGFVPPEGPGHPKADLYAVGMLLYCMTTGQRCTDFPSLPSLTSAKASVAFARVNDTILRACARDAEARYASARSMHDALLKLGAGANKRALSQRRKPAKTSTAQIIRTKRDFTALCSKAINEAVSRFRVGYAHDEQFLTISEMRSVTRAVREFFRSHLRYVPDGVEAVASMADAVLEPNRVKRRNLLESSIGLRKKHANSAQADDNSIWGTQVMQSLLSGWTSTVDRVSGQLSVEWYVNYFGFLQDDPDKATATALTYLSSGIAEVINGEWLEFREAMGIPTN